MEGPDHSASLEHDQFKQLVLGIREIELALKVSQGKKISQGEKINRENLSKSLVSSTKIKKGTIITKEDIRVLSPGLGLSPQYMNDLIGRKIKETCMKRIIFLCLIYQIKFYQNQSIISKDLGVSQLGIMILLNFQI